MNGIKTTLWSQVDFGSKKKPRCDLCQTSRLARGKLAITLLRNETWHRHFGDMSCWEAGSRATGNRAEEKAITGLVVETLSELGTHRRFFLFHLWWFQGLDGIFSLGMVVWRRYAMIVDFLHMN